MKKDDQGMITIPILPVLGNLLTTFWGNQDDVDFTLIVEDEEIKIHKLVLLMYSDYFRSTLRMNPQKNEVVIEEQPSLVKKLVALMYGQPISIAPGELMNVLQLAEYFQIVTLTQLLSESPIITNPAIMTKSTICTLLTKITSSSLYLLSRYTDSYEGLDHTISIALDDVRSISREAMIIILERSESHLPQNIIRLINRWCSTHEQPLLLVSGRILLRPNFILPDAKDKFYLNTRILDQDTPVIGLGLDLEYPHVPPEKVTLSMFRGDPVMLMTETQLVKVFGKYFTKFKEMYNCLPSKIYFTLNEIILHSGLEIDVSDIDEDGNGWCEIDYPTSPEAVDKMSIPELYLYSKTMLPLLLAYKSLSLTNKNYFYAYAVNLILLHQQSK